MLRGGRVLSSCLVLALGAGMAACGGRVPGGVEGRLVVEHDTVGDTVVVRTVSGSVWGAVRTLVPEISIGEASGDSTYLFGQISALAVGPDGTIYVLDDQAMEIRAYGPDGKYVRKLGRRGGGPGELSQPDGMVVLSDGRLLVNDLGNQRIQVYAPNGSPAGEWPVHQGNDFTSEPLSRDEHDEVYLKVLRHDPTDFMRWRTMFVHIEPSGSLGDTVRLPDSGYRRPTLEVRTEHGSTGFAVPFAPAELWAFDPEGFFVHAIGSRYRIGLLRANGPVLHIERTSPPAPVASGERTRAEAPILRTARRLQPGWHWTGPSIPDRKPFFKSIMVGRQGRIWVLLYTAARERNNPHYDPKDPNSPRTLWVEPVAFDVFEGDGTYLGRVDPPGGFVPFPTPRFDGDQVWAVTRDSLGVGRVVRYRIAVEAVGAGGS